MCPYLKSECLKAGCEAYEPPETDNEGETIGDYCNIIEGHTELIGLSDELAIKDIETAHGVMLALRQKLDGNDGPEA